jgi:hypothetical protein
MITISTILAHSNIYKSTFQYLLLAEIAKEHAPMERKKNNLPSGPPRVPKNRLRIPIHRSSKIALEISALDYLLQPMKRVEPSKASETRVHLTITTMRVAPALRFLLQARVGRIAIRSMESN